MSVCVTPIFSADYTVPPKEVKPTKSIKMKNGKDSAKKMPKHAQSNMSYKLSMKNKYMKIKSYAGIENDLSSTKKNNEKTKLETSHGTKILTKSKGLKNKDVGIKTGQLPLR